MTTANLVRFKKSLQSIIIRCTQTLSKKLLIYPFLGKGEIVWIYGEDQAFLNDLMFNIMETGVRVRAWLKLPEEQRIFKDPENPENYKAYIETTSIQSDDLWYLKLDQEPLNILYITPKDDGFVNEENIDEVKLNSFGLGIECVELEYRKDLFWSSQQGQRIYKRFDKYDLIIIGSCQEFFDKRGKSPKKIREYLQPYLDMGKSFIILDKPNKTDTLHRSIYKSYQADLVIKLSAEEDHYTLKYESCKIKIAHRFQNAEGIKLLMEP